MACRKKSLTCYFNLTFFASQPCPHLLTCLFQPCWSNSGWNAFDAQHCCQKVNKRTVLSRGRTTLPRGRTTHLATLRTQTVGAYFHHFHHPCQCRPRSDSFEEREEVKRLKTVANDICTELGLEAGTLVKFADVRHKGRTFRMLLN